MTHANDCRSGRPGARHRAVEDAVRLDALVDGVLDGRPIEVADVPRRVRELLGVVHLLASHRAPTPNAPAAED